MSDGRRNPWWDDADPGPGMTRTAIDLRSRDESRRTAVRVWDDLYDGRTVAVHAGVDPFGVLGRAGIDVPSVNVTRNIVDFVHSKVAAETPSVRADTRGGDWAAQRRATKLTRFVGGLMAETNGEVVLPGALLQAMRVGTGAAKVVVREGRLALEITSARELLVDPDDARHGDPRCLYQVKPMDPHLVASQFPDHADAILACAGTTDAFVGGLADPWSLTATDQGIAVDLFEAWCLPRGGEPGRHVVAIEGTTLLDEPWAHPRFPIAMLRPTEPRPGGGFWGQGFVERMVPLQYEINETIAAINKAERLTQLRVFVSDDMDLVEEALEDPAIGNVIKYKGGQVPVFHTPAGVNEQRIGWLKQLMDWAYSSFGMNEQAASSQRPAGVNSGRAILFFHDFQTMRHVDLVKRYGRFVVDVVDRLLDAAAALAEAGEPLAASPARAIDWTEVAMDRDQFVLELEEASPVPDTFAGRLQQVEQDVAEGRLRQEDLLRLRQDPDLERRWDIATADGEFVDWAVEELLDGRMPPVLDEMDKPLMVDRLRAEILRATMAGADPDAIDLLRRYAGDVVAGMGPQAPAPGPAPLPAAPGPQPLPEGGLAPGPLG